MPSSRSRLWRGTGFILLILTAAGCGYRLGSHGTLPGAVTSLHITIFENRTAEMGLENLITEAITREFRLHRKTLLADAATADGVLKGVITAVRVDTVVRQSLAAGGEKRIYVTMDVTLRDRGGNTVWAITHLSDHETFRAGFEPEANRRYQEEALYKLARRMAETLLGHLTSGF